VFVFFKANPTKEAYTSLAFWTMPACTGKELSFDEERELLTTRARGKIIIETRELIRFMERNRGDS